MIFNAAVFILFIYNPFSYGQEEMKHSYTFIGEITNKGPRYNPFAVSKPDEVKKLLVEMAKSPMKKEEIDSRLSSSPTKIDDLLRVELIKQEDSFYSINFPFYFARDIAIIRDVADKYGKILAENILKKRDPIYSLLDKVKPSSVSKDKLAFILVGAMALDLGALDLLSDNRYIVTDVERPGGNRYVLSAQEVTGFSKKELYWGCHSQNLGKFVYLTFGDRESETDRNGFPDILWNWNRKISALDIPELYREELLDINRVFFRGLIQTIDNVLLGLKEGPWSLDDLVEKSSVSKDEVQSVLEMLAKINYVRIEEGKYFLNIPVLSETDKEIVQAVRKIVFQEILAWAEAYYKTIQVETKDIAPLKNNMDFRQMFWFLWHYIFGSTNKHLAHSGFLFDTYKASQGFRGYLPGAVSSAIWK